MPIILEREPTPVYFNPFVDPPIPAQGDIVPEIRLNDVRRLNDFGDETDCTQDNCEYCFESPDNEYVQGLGSPQNDTDTTDNEGEDTSLTNADQSSCDCESCKVKKHLPSVLTPRAIGSWNDRPSGGWIGKRADNDSSTYFLGVELETDIPPYRGADVPYDLAERAADMRRPANHWIAKHDGSVYGPEFASHPATLRWWRNHNKSLNEMFTMLLHAGYRSYDGGRAGMHVNISRNAFDSPEHLFRFLRLTHIKPNWTVLMAQRTTDQATHWARFTNMGSSIRDWKRWADRHFNDRNASHEKYSVLNAPRGQDRFEFRIPRGTLRLDRFYKNLEWVQSMIEFTRNLVDETDANPIEFTRSLDDGRMYRNMVSFMNERALLLTRAAQS